MRVLLCGGGSAGHVNPALAIGETIQRNLPGSQIAYVVTSTGIENKLVKYKKYSINVKGFKRSASISNFKSAFLLMDAIKKSKKIIKDFCPDVIIGTGGYATYPVVYAGQKMGIKTVLHESNACPGKAIKMLENKVDLIFTNFAESEKFFKNKNRAKIIRVGNPLRNGFEEYDKEELKERLNIKEKYVILCYGGSLGAEKINNSAIEIIENYIRYQENIRFIFATGKRSYQDVLESLKNKRLNRLKNVSVSEYIYDMPEKMAIADIVISRSGAMTISELAASKKCSILIPSTNVTNNHQMKNAKALEKEGAAIVVPESETYTLIDIIKDLISNNTKRTKMEKNINKFHFPDAKKNIYMKLINLLN